MGGVRSVRPALGRGLGSRVGACGPVAVAVRVGRAVGVRGDEALGDTAVCVGLAVGRGRGAAEDSVAVGGATIADVPGGVAEVGWSRCRISVTPKAVTTMAAPISTKSTASSGERRRGGGGATGQGFHPAGGEGGYDTER